MGNLGGEWLKRTGLTLTAEGDARKRERSDCTPVVSLPARRFDLKIDFVVCSLRSLKGGGIQLCA